MNKQLSFIMPYNYFKKKKNKYKINLLRFSVTALFRFVARFTRGRIEDSSRNRFALNGCQRIACFIVFSS